MYCKECGKEIHDDSKYCSFCGKFQSSITTETVIPLPITSPNEINVNISLAGKKKETTNRIEVKEKKELKFDNTYKKEYEATVVGCVLISINLLFIFAIQNDSFQIDKEIRNTITLINFIYRIVVVIWISKISQRQNRTVIGWSIFGFFLPSLALVIIGLLKKVNIKHSNMHQTYSQITNEETLIKEMEKWNIKFEDGKYILQNRYKYDQLNDAIEYAKFLEKRSIP